MRGERRGRAVLSTFCQSGEREGRLGCCLSADFPGCNNTPGIWAYYVLYVLYYIIVFIIVFSGQ